MQRRDALRRLALASLATTSPAWVTALSGLAHTHASGARPQSRAPRQLEVFTAHQNETVVALTELIIPRTDTAGAKAAEVNVFIDTVLDDANANERNEFLRGLIWIDDRSQELFGANFVEAAENEQTALLTIISSEDNQSLPDRIGVEFFQAIKQLTVTGYYTSEIGMLEELDDDGGLDFDDDPGCQHPEHQRHEGSAQ
jgi:gluconate 2-dehydrogenase gamma chain